MPMTLDPGKVRDARKMDRKRVLKQAQTGLLTHKEIAQANGMSESAVWKFLYRSKPEIQALTEFQSNRSVYLDKLQAQCVDVQSRILATLTDGIIGTLKNSEKSALLFATNALAGTSYDKSRLEKGLSTENHSIVSKLLDARVQARYKPAKDKQPSKQHAEAGPDIKEIISASDRKQELPSQSD